MGRFKWYSAIDGEERIVMGQLLIRWFIKQPDTPLQPDTRTAYGKLAGAAGLVANILLFAAKVLAGVLTGSLSVVADAFNNLSDAGSSIVTLVGFRLSSAPPDKEHPFGHGRMEYLSTLLVAVLIILAGVELASASIEKITDPSLPVFNPVSLIILVVSIAAKLWMALFYRHIGRLIQSDTLKAAMTDSRNDVICTAIVLVGLVVGAVWQVAVDGYIGMAIALFVIWSGIDVLRQTVSLLIGQAPDPELVKGIKETVLGYNGVVGIHDMMIHNYGPGRCIVSLHAEVPCREDIMKSHEIIDQIERELMDKYHVVSCIHMDPIDTDDERIGDLQMLAQTVLQDIDEHLQLHDFRVVFGESHTNLIFDVAVPLGHKATVGLADEMQRRIHMVNEKLFTVITVEHSYI